MTWPIFLAPLVCGKRFPWLFDCCGPLKFWLQALIIVIQVKLETEATENLARSFLAHHFGLVGLVMMYLIYDFFLISETLFSRISNFLGFTAA